MKTLALLLIAILACGPILAQESSPRQLQKMNKAASSLFKGQCPLERIDWMEVSESFDKNALIELATQLEAATKLDAAKVRGIASGDLTGNLSSDFSRKVNKLVERKVQVSQEFYETYLMFEDQSAIFISSKKRLLQ